MRSKSPASDKTKATTSARSCVPSSLFLSIAVPLGFIAYVDHVHKETGINWLGALGALVALSLVIATAVISTRR